MDILMSTNWGLEGRKVMVYWLVALGRRLVWVSRMVEPERMVAVMG